MGVIKRYEDNMNTEKYIDILSDELIDSFPGLRGRNKHLIF